MRSAKSAAAGANEAKRRPANRDPSALLLQWYAEHGRAHLPWRQSSDAYGVVVSEFMLQQTQVDRALPKYRRFVERFPDFRALAAASQADVLRMWQGLGYNSRAVRLHALARAVLERFDGVLPAASEALRELPGVGPYTAAAVRAFAFNGDEPAMDTNVRRIVHRWLFGMEYPALASAAQLDERARELIPPGRGRDWNSAAMDLGASICTARAPKCGACPVAAVCTAAPIDAAALEKARLRYGRKRSPQEAIPFERSTRFARGRIVDSLRALAPGAKVSLLDLHHGLRDRLPQRSLEDVRTIVAGLERDGLVAVMTDGVALKD